MAYTIGVDFGSLAVRALLVAVEDGREVAAASAEYPHAVMTRELPDGTPLKPDWALQHPQDYLDCLDRVMHEVVEKAGVPTEEIIAVTQVPIF